MKIALEPPAFLVARPHDPSARLLHLRKLEPYLESEACDLDREARRRENAAEQVGTVEERGLVPEERDLLPLMRDPRQRALVVRRIAEWRP